MNRQITDYAVMEWSPVLGRYVTVYARPVIHAGPVAECKGSSSSSTTQNTTQTEVKTTNKYLTENYDYYQTYRYDYGKDTEYNQRYETDNSLQVDDEREYDYSRETDNSREYDVSDVSGVSLLGSSNNRINITDSGAISSIKSIAEKVVDQARVNTQNILSSVSGEKRDVLEFSSDTLARGFDEVAALNIRSLDAVQSNTERVLNQTLSFARDEIKDISTAFSEAAQPDTELLQNVVKYVGGALLVSAVVVAWRS